MNSPPEEGQVVAQKSNLAWGNWEPRTEYVELPELNDMFVVEEGKIAVFKVRQATLDEMIRAQLRGVDTETVLQHLTQAINTGEAGKVAGIIASESEKLHPNTEYELKLLRTCIIEPKLDYFDLKHLQELFPTVCNRISRKIMELSVRGGVKKNLNNSDITPG